MCNYRNLLVMVLGVAVVYSHRSEAALPPLPKPDYPVVSALDYRDTAAVQREWTPGEAGVPATVEQLAGRNVVKLTCNFENRKGSRAFWDFSVSLDLSHCQGIQFRFYCSDMSPIGSCSLYLKSVSGWYKTSMGSEKKGDWCTVVVDKSHTGIEGKPAGWGRIDGIRISPWRGGYTNTDLYVADLGIFNPDPPIALLRVENIAQGANWHMRRSQRLAEHLAMLSLSYTLLNENDVEGGFLKDVELFMMPTRWGLSQAAADNAVKFVKGGGKLLCFDGLPANFKPPLREEDGVYTTAFPGESGDRAKLMALIGRIAPPLWQESARAAISRIGTLGAYHSFEEAVRGIKRLAGGGRKARDLLRQARAVRTRANSQYREKKYEQAAATAAEAHRLLVEGYCVVQKPKEGEFRGFWCHSAFGVKGMTWDEAIKMMADNGFNAILPNMLWGATTYGQSDVLIVHPDVNEKGDQIAECLAACKKYGVECHPWKVNWNMGWRVPKDVVEKMNKAGRVQVTFDGTVQEKWLCPSHPENQKQEIEAMVEVATRYDVHGIHFDYIRYPGNHCCFCQGCRKRFEEFVGRKVRNWPADVRSDPELEKRWQEFRRNNITMVVAAVSERVRKTRPKVEISAAVFRNWPADRISVAQDWKVWCDKGYLDFVCPMDYTPSNGKFESAVESQLKWAGNVRCCPGIGASLWKPPTVDKLIDQISIARRLGTAGFTIFEYSTRTRDLLPMCGKGITRKR